MRILVALSSLALVSAPALAQGQSPATPQPKADPVDNFEIPAEFTDPAMAETLGKMLANVTKAMMDMPIGEMQAAAEGREPTAADRTRTVRDLAGREANLEGKVEQQVRQAMPRMQATMKAMAKSLPAMAKAMEKATEGLEGSLDRATANLPQPGYPKQ